MQFIVDSIIIIVHHIPILFRLWSPANHNIIIAEVIQFRLNCGVARCRRIHWMCCASTQHKMAYRRFGGIDTAIINAFCIVYAVWKWHNQKIIFYQAMMRLIWNGLLRNRMLEMKSNRTNGDDKICWRTSIPQPKRTTQIQPIILHRTRLTIHQISNIIAIERERWILWRAHKQFVAMYWT